MHTDTVSVAHTHTPSRVYFIHLLRSFIIWYFDCVPYLAAYLSGCVLTISQIHRYTALHSQFADSPYLKSLYTKAMKSAFFLRVVAVEPQEFLIVLMQQLLVCWKIQLERVRLIRFSFELIIWYDIWSSSSILWRFMTIFEAVYRFWLWIWKTCLIFRHKLDCYTLLSLDISKLEL